MSLRPRRRIFRRSLSAPPPRNVGRAMAVGLGVAVLAGGAVLLGQSTSLFGRDAAPATRATAKAADVAVIDGSTLRLRDRILRLKGIEPPTRGQACGATADCGAASAAQLAALVRDRVVECSLDGHDPNGRPYGACQAGGIDLSAGMVSRGWAQADGSALRGQETEARQAGLGMWHAQ